MNNLIQNGREMTISSILNNKKDLSSILDDILLIESFEPNDLVLFDNYIKKRKIKNSQFNKELEMIFESFLKIAGLDENLKDKIKENKLIKSKANKTVNPDCIGYSKVEETYNDCKNYKILQNNIIADTYDLNLKSTIPFSEYFIYSLAKDFFSPGHNDKRVFILAYLICIDYEEVYSGEYEVYYALDCLLKDNTRISNKFDNINVDLLNSDNIEVANEVNAKIINKVSLGLNLSKSDDSEPNEITGPEFSSVGKTPRFNNEVFNKEAPINDREEKMNCHEEIDSSIAHKKETKQKSDREIIKKMDKSNSNDQKKAAKYEIKPTNTSLDKKPKIMAKVHCSDEFQTTKGKILISYCMNCKNNYNGEIFDFKVSSFLNNEILELNDFISLLKIIEIKKSHEILYQRLDFIWEHLHKNIVLQKKEADKSFNDKLKEKIRGLFTKFFSYTLRNKDKSDNQNEIEDFKTIPDKNGSKDNSQDKTYGTSLYEDKDCIASTDKYCNLEKLPQSRKLINTQPNYFIKDSSIFKKVDENCQHLGLNINKTEPSLLIIYNKMIDILCNSFETYNIFTERILLKLNNEYIAKQFSIRSLCPTISLFRICNCIDPLFIEAMNISLPFFDEIPRDFLLKIVNSALFRIDDYQGFKKVVGILIQKGIDIPVGSLLVFRKYDKTNKIKTPAKVPTNQTIVERNMNSLNEISLEKELEDEFSNNRHIKEKDMLTGESIGNSDDTSNNLKDRTDVSTALLDPAHKNTCNDKNNLSIDQSISGYTNNYKDSKGKYMSISEPFNENKDIYRSPNINSKSSKFESTKVELIYRISFLLCNAEVDKKRLNLFAHRAISNRHLELSISLIFKLKEFNFFKKGYFYLNGEPGRRRDALINELKKKEYGSFYYKVVSFLLKQKEFKEDINIMGDLTVMNDNSIISRSSVVNSLIDSSPYGTAILKKLAKKGLLSVKLANDSLCIPPGLFFNNSSLRIRNPYKKFILKIDIVIFKETLEDMTIIELGDEAKVVLEDGEIKVVHNDNKLIIMSLQEIMNIKFNGETVKDESSLDVSKAIDGLDESIGINNDEIVNNNLNVKNSKATESGNKNSYSKTINKEEDDKSNAEDDIILKTLSQMNTKATLSSIEISLRFLFDRKNLTIYLHNIEKDLKGIAINEISISSSFKGILRSLLFAETIELIPENKRDFSSYDTSFKDVKRQNNSFFKNKHLFFNNYIKPIDKFLVYKGRSGVFIDQLMPLYLGNIMAKKSVEINEVMLID